MVNITTIINAIPIHIKPSKSFLASQDLAAMKYVECCLKESLRSNSLFNISEFSYTRTKKRNILPFPNPLTPPFPNLF